MTIAENPNSGKQAEEIEKRAKNKLFFTDDELDLLDISETHTRQGGEASTKASAATRANQIAISILLLTAIASFALGMLTEKSITGSNGVTGAGSDSAGQGTRSLSGLTLPASNAVEQK